ncbi:MAG TPA: hypothetical protein VEW07_04570 [Solirubrobacterales bacterium]|nr:hypothetical protein [Solirubrobacterales bacterium]
MGNDLIACIVALALGAVVVGLGWRRNLGETTQEWLPRFGEASEQEAPVSDPVDGGQRRRPLSPRQRRWIIWGYLLISLGNVALAVVWADDRLFRAIIAAGFAFAAVMFWLEKWPLSVGGSTS